MEIPKCPSLWHLPIAVLRATHTSAKFTCFIKNVRHNRTVYGWTDNDRQIRSCFVLSISCDQCWKNDCILTKIQSSITIAPSRISIMRNKDYNCYKWCDRTSKSKAIVEKLPVIIYWQNFMWFIMCSKNILIMRQCLLIIDTAQHLAALGTALNCKCITIQKSKELVRLAWKLGMLFHNCWEKMRWTVPRPARIRSKIK